MGKRRIRILYFSAPFAVVFALVYLNDPESHFNRATFERDCHRVGIRVPIDYRLLYHDEGSLMDDGYFVVWKMRSKGRPTMPFAPLEGPGSQGWRSNLDFARSALEARSPSRIGYGRTEVRGLVYEATLCEENGSSTPFLSIFPNADTPTGDAVG